MTGNRPLRESMTACFDPRHAFVFKLPRDEAKPKVIWSGVGGPLKDYAAFVDALRNGKLDDRVNYAH